MSKNNGKKQKPLELRPEDALKCQGCPNDLFSTVYHVHQVPAGGTAPDILVPVALYMCINCGQILGNPAAQKEETT